MKTFMMRVSVCMFLLLTFFSLGCSAQIKGELKLVTELSELSSEKSYALIATVDGKMYAMQAKKESTGRLCVENITENPYLFDGDNVFKMGKPSHYTNYSKCSSFSQKGGTQIYHGGIYLSLKYSNSKYNDGTFYFFMRNGYDGVIMGTADTYPICVGIGNQNQMYCKGYGGAGKDNIPMQLYEYIESPTSDTQVGSIEIKTTEGYATYYNSKSFVVPNGLTAAIVKEADKQNGELSLDWKYKAGDVIPGATALLIHGEKGTYQLNAPADEAESQKSGVSALSVDAENLLRGSDEDSETKGTEEGVPYYFYKLSYLTDAESGDKVLGFYWGTTSGASFTNKANHAYLALKQSVSYQVKGFQLPSFSDVTGISVPLAPNIGQSTTNYRQGVFSLDGVRLHVTDVQSLPAGIYIVNGQKCLKK